MMKRILSLKRYFQIKTNAIYKAIRIQSNRMAVKVKTVKADVLLKLE